MSIQNQSGRLNLYVKDTGTSNVYPHIRTLRFDPVGSITRGPAGQEVTIDTNFAGGGAAQYADVLWKVGSTAPGTTGTICAKYAPNCDATGENAVAHGESSVASGINSYAGGNTCQAQAPVSHVSGLSNTIETNSDNSTIIGGTENNIEESTNAAIIGGSNNTLTASDNSVILGGTGVGAAPVTQSNVTYVGKHLEVGQTSTPASIKRISTTQDWEDGDCGNSTLMWFTLSDFKKADTTTPGTITGQMLGMSTNRTNGIISSGGNRPCVLYSHPTSTRGQFVAIKLLPKGFETSDSATFRFAGTPTWCGAPALGADTLGVYSLSLTDGTLTQIGNITLAPVATQIVTLSVTAQGTGDTAIMIVINQRTAYLPISGIISVSVGITRP